jgi:hypothetical protein
MRNEVAMADRGRDLKIGVIAATDKFDLDEPARDLEKLGDAAKSAGREVDAGAKVAESAFEDLANEGNQTQRDLSKYLDKIGKEARAAGREVDAGLDKGRQGLDDFKGEAHQSGRETAASFQGGFDDVTGFVQETAANAFGGFGKIGAAAGIAAAVGLGILTSKLEETRQRLTELRQLFFDIGKDDAGSGIQGRINKIADELGPDKLAQLRSDLRNTGTDADTFFKALAGDPTAGAAVRSQIEGLQGFFSAPWDDTANSAFNLNKILELYKQSGAEGADALTLYKDVVVETGEASQDAAPQVDSLSASLKSAADAKHAENLAGISSGLRDVADASGEVAEAVGKDGQVSISTVTKLLQEQTKAAKKHRANVQKALTEGGEAFAAWVSGQGAEVSQAYAAGSAKQRAALRAAFSANVGSAMGDGITAGLNAKKPAASAAASRIHAEIRDQLSGRVNVPVGVTPPSAAAVAAAANSVQRMMNARSLRWRTEIADVRIP